MSKGGLEVQNIKIKLNIFKKKNNKLKYNMNRKQRNSCVENADCLKG